MGVSGERSSTGGTVQGERQRLSAAQELDILGRPGDDEVLVEGGWSGSEGEGRGGQEQEEEYKDSCCRRAEATSRRRRSEEGRGVSFVI